MLAAGLTTALLALAYQSARSGPPRLPLVLLERVVVVTSAAAWADLQRVPAAIAAAHQCGTAAPDTAR